MLCHRQTHPWCAPSLYGDAHPIVCRFCDSAPSGTLQLKIHSVMMKHSFAVSGCATAAPVADSVEEPVISVPSSGETMWKHLRFPWWTTPFQQDMSLLFPERARLQWCVFRRICQARLHLLLFRISIVLEGTGVLECHDHKLDHGVPDPKCDYCKRALGPLKNTLGTERFRS